MAKRPRLDNHSAGLEGPSEAEILRLVAQRESARQARRFDESDAIREDLRSMGVELFDKDKEWKCMDGRRGTLFTAGPTECTLSDSGIQERIAVREEARKSKDWALADVLRDELRRLGVELDDRDKAWSTSGGRRGTYFGAPISSGRLGPAAANSHIRCMVAERERHRANQNFDAADDVRRQLSQIGVEIFDNEIPRVWRSNDGLLGAVMGRGEEVECTWPDTEIQSRVQQREVARSAKRFAEADSIRDELRRHGVELLDSSKQWCTTDGRNGPFNLERAASQRAFVPSGVTPPPLRGAPPLPAGYQRAPADPVAQAAEGLLQLAQKLQERQAGSKVQAVGALQTADFILSDASIAALVLGREKARENKCWQAADEIRADLRAHGVEVFDKEKVWKSSDGRSGPIVRS